MGAEAQGALIGLLSGVGLGAALDSPLVAIVVGLAGGLIGHWVGSSLQEAEVIYHVREVYPGRLELTPVPRSTTVPGGYFPAAAAS